VITKRAKAEADYYLSFTPSLKAEEADYEEWFGHDSKGLPCSLSNPVLEAKRFYGICVDAVRRDYHEMGRFILLDELNMGRPLRFLSEAIGLDRIKKECGVT